MLHCAELGCMKIAVLECSCKEKKRLCHIHSSSHASKFKCFLSSVEEETLMIQSKFYQSKNVLKQLSLDIISFADLMIKKINKCVKDNLIYIKEQETKVDSFIIGHIKDPFNEIMNWADSIKLFQRDLNKFTQVVTSFLDIKESNIIKEPSSSICDTKFDGENKSQNILTCDEEFERKLKSYDEILQKNSYLNERLQSLLLQCSQEKIMLKGDFLNGKFI